MTDKKIDILKAESSCFQRRVMLQQYNAVRYASFVNCSRRSTADSWCEHFGVSPGQLEQDYILAYQLTHDAYHKSINNGIDSAEPNTLEFAPFINIMSEWYAKDISKKGKTGIKTKGMSGKPICTEVPFGYIKTPTIRIIS